MIPSRRERRGSKNKKFCRRNVTQLIRFLRNDTEMHGLQEFQDFSGLNRNLFSVLEDHRIAFVGDSTLHYLAKDFCRLLNYDWREPFNTTSLSAAHEQLRAFPAFSEKLSCQAKKKTLFAWTGTTGHDDHVHTEQILDATWKRVEEIQPTIMVVNMGLHWLHFYNMARTTSLEAVRRWIHYEDWLNQVYEKAVSLNVKALLYKTTNFVCDEKLYDNYLEAHSLYKMHDSATITKCIDSIQAKDPSLPRNQIADYCSNGTINNHGSERLNNRLERFVSSLTSSAIPVAVYRDRDVQQCQFCGERDGLHYHDVALVRIRLLAHLLECLL